MGGLGQIVVWEKVTLVFLMLTLLFGSASVVWPNNSYAQDQPPSTMVNINWRKVIEENTRLDTLESRLLRGIASANLGQLPIALKELEIAGEATYSDQVAEFVLDKLRRLRRSPNDLLLLNCAAFGSYAFGDLEQSTMYFEDIIRLDPNSVWARNFCAIVYGQTGELDRALYHLEHSLKLDTENQYTHLLLSAVYKEKQKFLLAIYHYMQAPQAVSELKRYGIF
jgi:tetratricopeptide (TPR) repeat protein